MIDDFRDKGFFNQSDKRLKIPEAYGVTVISRDLISEGIDFAPDSVDAFTCFDAMEHWHNSPKALFHELMKALRPGGVLLIGGPNCANLRKRLMLLLGRAKWTSMEDWYEAPVFHSHVREPDVDDLLYIARDLKLDSVRVFGRNWHFLKGAPPSLQPVAALADISLRPFPSLCGDIYLLGHKKQ